MLAVLFAAATLGALTVLLADARREASPLRSDRDPGDGVAPRQDRLVAMFRTTSLVMLAGHALTGWATQGAARSGHRRLAVVACVLALVGVGVWVAVGVTVAQGLPAGK